MFLDVAGVTFLFRVINLSVFIFFIFYLFKKYAVKAVRKQITDKEQAMVDLQNRAQVLVHDIRAIEQTTQQDKLMCQDLKARVVEWRIQAEQIEQARILKKQQQMNALVDHVRIQTTHLQQTKTYEFVLPLVVDQTYKKLEQKFENEALAETFIAQLINSMQKGG